MQVVVLVHCQNIFDFNPPNIFKILVLYSGLVKLLYKINTNIVLHHILATNQFFPLYILTCNTTLKRSKQILVGLSYKYSFVREKKCVLSECHLKCIYYV